MPEEQAFCVLVKIMYEYGLRALYKNNFEDLHCKFYQLERLMQVSYAMFDNIGKVMEWKITMQWKVPSCSEDDPDFMDDQRDG